MIDHSIDYVHASKPNAIIKSLDGLIGTRNRPTVLRRLRWIEDRLWWHGFLKRAEAVERFGISPQQASQDIATYQHVRPGLAKLDTSSKVYVRAPEIEPVFPKDPFRWIAEEMAESAPVLPLERLPSPSRRAEPEVMSTLLVAFDIKQAVTIDYQSLSQGGISRRIICPHHIVDTDQRCHIRAWDSLRGRFADFVIGRILSGTPCHDYPWVDALADQFWHEHIAIILGPDSELTQAQRRVVQQDYGMRNGRIEITVRKALVTYVAASLGILDEIQGTKNPRRNRELQCINAIELKPLVPTQAEG